MTTSLAELHHKPAILAIFAITYVGIAMGHVPGLKLNRVGIALLGAIGMMIFGGIGTGEVISYINWPTVFYWKFQLETARECGADGIVIWGNDHAHWNDPSTWRADTLQFIAAKPTVNP